MNIRSSSSSSSFLPEDLLIEILLCTSLPVKTLVRFKSVSKSWFALIDSSDYIHRHANNTNNNYSSSSSKLDSSTLIFQSWHKKLLENSSARFWNLFSISCDADNHGEYEEEEDFGMAPPSCYYNSNKSLLENLCMVGYCNGVICLYDYKLRDVSLWNPAIHQFRFLPKSPYTTINNSYVNNRGRDFIAFGFDVETKDYKVVLVTADQPLVQVYSLSTDSWRTLEHNVVLPTCPWDNYGGGYLNGSYYCAGVREVLPFSDYCKGITSFKTEKGSVREVLSFDFTEEIFKTLPLPDEINEYIAPYHDLEVVFLGGKIAFFHNLYPTYHRRNTYEFWVLNELGVKESWTKLYTIGPYLSIDPSTNGKRYRPLTKRYRPIGFSNNGEFIFMVTLDENQFLLLNPSTQVMKELQRDGNQSFGSGIFKIFVYRRSLVPICSTTKGSTSSLKFNDT